MTLIHTVSSIFMTDRFVIYQDIPKSHEIKIHRIGCSTYVNRNQSAKNSIWYTAHTFEIAVNIAKKLANEDKINYRNCKLCNHSTP